MVGAGGFDFLARQLFSTPAPGLQVTPRRLAALSTTLTTTGGGAVDNPQFVVPAISDILQSGDGLLIEWMTLFLRPNIGTATPLSTVMLLRIQPNIPLTFALLATPRETYQGSGLNAGLLLGFVFQVPLFLTSFDIQRLFLGVGPLPAAAQPLRFVVALSIQDSGATQTFPVIATVQYRLVRGLQEN